MTTTMSTVMTPGAVHGGYMEPLNASQAALMTPGAVHDGYAEALNASQAALMTPGAVQDEYIEALNASQAALMTPVIVFMSALMLVGLGGNLVVVTVLVCKKNKSIANYFMLSLAVIDLIR